MKLKQNYWQKTVLLIGAIFLLLTACETTEPDQTNLSLSFATDSNLPKSTGDDLQLQEVKLLIRNIKIKNQSGEDSLHIKTGPMVVQLNLQGGLTEFSSSEIPQGTYNRVRFEIHKLEDSETPPDQEFKEGSESSKRYSIVVKGTLNGESFMYKSKKSAVQDIKLEEDLVVEENADANLTIKVDPFSWFYQGDLLLNPNDSANDDKIDNNLKNSFNIAFCDKDRNGTID